MDEIDSALHLDRWMFEATGGDWEARARRLGMIVKPIRGLRFPRAVVADGCPPILLIPDDITGREREYQFAWLVGEVYTRVLGEPCTLHELQRALRALMEAG